MCMAVVILCPHDFIILHRINGIERQESKRFIVPINNSSELEVYVINARVLQPILRFVYSAGSVKMLFLSVLEHSLLFTLLKPKHVQTEHHYTTVDDFGTAMNISSSVNMQVIPVLRKLYERMQFFFLSAFKATPSLTLNTEDFKIDVKRKTNLNNLTLLR